MVYRVVVPLELLLLYTGKMGNCGCLLSFTYPENRMTILQKPADQLNMTHVNMYDHMSHLEVYKSFIIC